MKYLVSFWQRCVLRIIMYIRVQVNNIAKRQFVQIEDESEITIPKFMKKGRQPIVD